MLNEKLIPSTIARKNDVDEQIGRINNKFVYSTKEQIIGNWINGKPIYRKIITGSLVNVGNDWTSITNINNVDEVINLNGVITNTATDNRSLNINTYENPSYNSVFSFSKKDGNAIQGKVTGWNSANLKFIFKLYFEYTKIID